MRDFGYLGWMPAVALAAAFAAQAAESPAHHHAHGGGASRLAPSPYAGQETRAIKTLSDKDIDDLRNGRGWGLAKAAELNGVPGPAHLLELKREIRLSPEQVRAIEKLFADMKARAIPLGTRLVELEHQLNRSFARRDIDREKLKARLRKIARVRAELRLVHLETHLRTPAILTHRQIAAYNRLRGYDSGPTPAGRGGHH